MSTQALTLKKYQAEALNTLEAFLQASASLEGSQDGDVNGQLAQAYADALAAQQRRVSVMPGDGGEAAYRDSFAKA